MKHRSTARTAIGVLAAAWFAAPASADPLWRFPNTELVCDRLEVSGPSTDPNLLSVAPGTGFNVLVINKHGLSETFNVQSKGGTPSGFCGFLYTKLQQACEQTDTKQYPHAKPVKNYVLSMAKNDKTIESQCPTTLGGVAGNAVGPNQGANITAVRVGTEAAHE